MKLFRIMVPVTLMLGMCLSIYATPEVTGKKKEKNGDAGTTITLVASGSGETKEEATKNALRSALEQTYGAFVSSNSQVVNDELVKDEIVSISTGNIVSYEELSFIDSSPKEVTVEAVVSITRLQNYAQNKGMSAELAGNTFAMNLKMEELNKKNQDIALKHLLEQTQIMSQSLFDYEINVGDPEKTPKGVQIPVTIQIKANKNTVTYYDYFHNTLTSLAVNKKTGKDVHLYGEQGIEIGGMEQFDENGIVYVLRGDARDPELHNTTHDIFSTLGSAVLNCEVVDNIGNVSGFKKESNHNNVTQDYVTTNKLSYTYHGGSGRSQQLTGYRNNYKPKTGRGLLIENLSQSGPRGVFFWMNAARPMAGETLYETKLFLMYSVEEISKISKIEIRPKKIENNTNEQEMRKILDDLMEAKKYIDLYNDESTSSEVAISYLEKAHSLLIKIKANPLSIYIVKPEYIEQYIDKISPILKKKKNDNYE